MANVPITNVANDIFIQLLVFIFKSYAILVLMSKSDPLVICLINNLSWLMFKCPNKSKGFYVLKLILLDLLSEIFKIISIYYKSASIDTP